MPSCDIMEDRLKNATVAGHGRLASENSVKRNRKPGRYSKKLHLLTGKQLQQFAKTELWLKTHLPKLIKQM